MKAITSLSLSLLTTCSVAQSPYRSFPEGSAGWVESHGWVDGSDVLTECTRTIRFAGDTIIGGTTYHQLRSIGDCSWHTIIGPFNYGTYVEPDAIFMRFRQDVFARKVFAYDADQQQEVLWFDFSLGLGSYPFTYDHGPSDSTEVVALDSMLLNDGYHRTWVLGTQLNGVLQDSAYCTIIEGVGSTYGLRSVLGLVPDFEWSDALVCHSANGNSIFPLGSGVCDLSMSVASTVRWQKELYAYPNPAFEFVDIDGDLPADVRYVVMNPLSGVVRTGSLHNARIELGGLDPGPYIIQLTDAVGGVIGVARLVEE